MICRESNPDKEIFGHPDVLHGLLEMENRNLWRCILHNSSTIKQEWMHKIWHITKTSHTKRLRIAKRKILQELTTFQTSSQISSEWMWFHFQKNYRKLTNIPVTISGSHSRTNSVHFSSISTSEPKEITYTRFHLRNRKSVNTNKINSAVKE